MMGGGLCASSPPQELIPALGLEFGSVVRQECTRLRHYVLQ